METESLRSVLLAVLAFLGAFQFNLKFEERPGKYNVEQIKTLLKCKGLKQSARKMRELLNAVSRYYLQPSR